MRIISGTHKGRVIRPPGNFRARPTTDIAREGLFNILSNEYDFEELTVADMFGGTGAISFEFASRGAKEVYCIEKNPVHYTFIKDTAKQLGFTNIKVFRNDAFKAINKLAKNSFDIVFADPPFDMDAKETFIKNTLEAGILKEGVLIFEHSDKEFFQRVPGFIEVRKYGKVNFSFFAPPATP
ncbi:MAG: RsmD family RNA methyltransferase [Salinivirgaceae bacterium]